MCLRKGGGSSRRATDRLAYIIVVFIGCFVFTSLIGLVRWYESTWMDRHTLIRWSVRTLVNIVIIIMSHSISTSGQNGCEIIRLQ